MQPRWHHHSYRSLGQAFFKNPSGGIRQSVRMHPKIRPEASKIPAGGKAEHSRFGGHTPAAKINTNHAKDRQN